MAAGENLWQGIYKKLCDILAAVGGTITVEPSEAWEALIQAAVEAALENANLDVTITNEPIEVVINTDDGPIEVTGTVTVNTDDGAINVIIDELPAVVLDPATINDLAVAIAGQTLSVELTAENIADLEAAFANAIRVSTPVPCSGFCWTSGETTGEFVGYAVQNQDGSHSFNVISGDAPPAGAVVECRNDKLLDSFINMECPDGEEEDPCLTGTGKTPDGRLKFDADPSSISAATWGTGTITVKFADPDCAAVSVSLSDFPLVIGTVDGEPYPTSIVDAINSIGGNFGASALGLDAEKKNSIVCVCGPTGGDWSMSIQFGNSSQNWQLNWVDATPEFTVNDDVGGIGLTGSVANC